MRNSDQIEPQKTNNKYIEWQINNSATTFSEYSIKAVLVLGYPASFYDIFVLRCLYLKQVVFISILCTVNLGVSGTILIQAHHCAESEQPLGVLYMGCFSKAALPRSTTSAKLYGQLLLPLLLR
jgi:hypothetical protein